MYQKFKEFLEKSPTPFHATHQVKRALLQKEFIELDESSSWELKENSRYFITRNDSSIIAFNYPSKQALLEGIHMSGAHTDSPALKIKPLPELKKAGVNQLSVEVYGGALLNPWFDRDLSIAGRVHFKDFNGEIASELIDFKRAIAYIPSLAIHLDSNANTSKTINAQKDLPAVISLDSETSFHDLLKEEIEAKVAEILSFDLLLYDVNKPSRIGMDESLIASARLDNLLSCFAGLEALLASDESKASLIVFNDHEEIGSSSTSGAQGNFLEIVLHRLIGSVEDFSRMMSASVMVSTDNAHALHPNFSDIHEPNHAPLIGQGVAVKYNANQAYATDSASAALFTSYAHKVGKKLQSYVVRSDTRCGSTIGPITATKLGIKTIDIGVPTWGMHSIRETAALTDVEDLILILTAYFKKSL
jgi:aspartyl aminopeptidase